MQHCHRTQTQFSERLSARCEVLPDESNLSDSLFLLYEALIGNEKLTLDEVRSICNVKNPMPLVQQARTRLGGS